MGFCKLRLEKFLEQVWGDLIWFEAGFSSFQGHGDHPKWLVAQPWDGGGARRRSWSWVARASNEVAHASTGVDRTCQEVWSTGLSWRTAVGAVKGWNGDKIVPGSRGLNGDFGLSGNARRRFWAGVGPSMAELRLKTFVGWRCGRICWGRWCTVTVRVSIEERGRWWREGEKVKTKERIIDFCVQ